MKMDANSTFRPRYVEKSQQKWNERYLAQHDRHRQHQGEASAAESISARAPILQLGIPSKERMLHRG